MLARYLTTIGILAALSAEAQSVEYSTPQPRVEDVNDRAVVITRVDLTAQYTIIAMRFVQRGQNQQGSTIHFVPSSRLYANDGAQSFKFIRASNIPTTKRRTVLPNEQVDFVAYFERLTPGIETFDLFECSDRNRPGESCFNFWGVHITNPATRRPRPKPVPVPVPTPEPDPVFVPTPATPALSIKGTVRDAKTGKAVAATLTYRLLSGAESMGDGLPDSTRANAQKGTYLIPGEALTVWDVTVLAKGYFGQRDTISIGRAEKTANFDLVPIVVGAKITLRNIYFAQSKYELQTESFPELDRLVGVMRQNPTMTIKLEGHTDIIGDFDANLELSRNRVQEVKRYLNTKGIAPGRVEAVGYGHSRPINSTPGKPHPENRRVELVITST